MTTKPSRLEKENLEAHVDICAERYNRLELQYQSLSTRMQEMKEEFKEDRVIIHDRIDKVKVSIEELKEDLNNNRSVWVDMQNSQNKVIITSAIAIIVALLGGIFMLMTQ